MTNRFRRRLLAGGLAVFLVGGALAVASWDVCLSARVLRGVKVPRCPDGAFRQTVGLNAHGLSRGISGPVSVWAQAHAPDPRFDGMMQGRVTRGFAELFLVDADGKETPLTPDKELPWTRDDADTLQARVSLPQVPDGDYTLRARVSTPLGTDSVDAPLPLYAPARVHVLTDRPLYEPGNEVRFRAVVLRAKDLSPLDGRPGTWLLKDPSGEVVLEERAPAGPWGVVAGSFPLDKGAPTGTWTVAWSSGAASMQATFKVEPFTLPRFRVEASSPRPFWRAGETPEVEGQVVYASGAPVAGAEVELDWGHSGAWPPPLEWMEDGGLPERTRTDAAGRFRVVLPRIPADLRGTAQLTASVAAKDGAGDRVGGGVSLLLTEDAIAVSPVTELEDGLVAGFSNRMYLRATTADGRVLPGTELTVKRAWDARDEGVRAVTDEDGVAAFQLDPGPPVNVVVPPMPVRRPPPPPPVALGGLKDVLDEDSEASLQDQLAVERWLPSLFPCARFVEPDDGSAEVTLGLRVGAGGAVADVVGADGALGACLASVLRTRALAPGRERVLQLALEVIDPGLPRLELEVETVIGNGGPLTGVLATAARDARVCLPRNVEQEAPLPAALSWKLGAKGLEVSTSWVSLPKQEDALPASVLPCIQARFVGLRLPASMEKVERSEALGVVRFTAYPAGASDEEDGPAMATTFLGYELEVSAGKDVGKTKLVLRPAQLPDMRLRATPVLARAGDEVRIDLMRGPGFTGQLPKELVLQAGGTRLESKVEKGAARFTLPADFEGWAEAQWGSAMARVYVAPRAQLSVEVSPEKPAYAPGELARLQLRTRVDGQDGPAAVGLFGVDETLAQLAPLPGGDSLGSVRPSPTVATPAFGVLDGQALAMGRIRGSNAAAAALLRVSAVPQREDAEPRVSVNATSPFAPDAELTEPFYAVLAELHTQVRQWEEKAPEGETLDPAGMAKLWEGALAACEKRGEKVTDAFGRRLRLSRLPQDLLGLTDPRSVVASGTRLPEDVENWNAWVAREAP
ncbi:MG2 domain-containing protein [Pyxidicoccus xibeiensis]|uniref:MG2 domain-containing protein n=1 Tax=Pyxidicoccus xibeiensis TaxID=2906759 RepID=UPI0020A76653|nr:MG2 domain-containing protein [Pyxidicoccus xibeiensis]MCP3136015.1 MG2 domain-containing protein [Pyxidicoccus xibeiensis]